VVDDSTFVRRTLRKIFHGQPGLSVVGEAGDGGEALVRIGELKPDIVTLDIQMPGMDGFTALRAIKARWPNLPVIVLASASQDGAGAALDALSLGAIDFVDKSRATAMDFHLLGGEILGKVTAALEGRRAAPKREPSLRAPLSRPPSRPGPFPDEIRMICIGASTGGPQAIQEVMDHLPGSFPFPMAIVQHMPVGFTGAFAERLNRTSPLEVKEAAEGDMFRPGRALIAPAGAHLVFREGLKGVTAGLEAEPAANPHVPSVDVLFDSAADVFGTAALGIVMTGMGSDGREGARALARRGAFVVAEAEESCAVYGMPRAVVDAGLADAVWTIAEITDQLGRAARGARIGEERTP
jgi:two-component system chemotaxis response regulator CheB